MGWSKRSRRRRNRRPRKAEPVQDASQSTQTSGSGSADQPSDQSSTPQTGPGKAGEALGLFFRDLAQTGSNFWTRFKAIFGDVETELDALITGDASNDPAENIITTSAFAPMMGEVPPNAREMLTKAIGRLGFDSRYMIAALPSDVRAAIDAAVTGLKRAKYYYWQPGIVESVLAMIFAKESSWNKEALNSTGAYGFAQITAYNAAALKEKYKLAKSIREDQLKYIETYFYDLGRSLPSAWTVDGKLQITANRSSGVDADFRKAVDAAVTNTYPPNTNRLIALAISHRGGYGGREDKDGKRPPYAEYETYTREGMRRVAGGILRLVHQNV